MAEKRFPRCFSGNWSIEGPVEETWALASDIEEHHPRVRRALLLSFAAALISMVVMGAGVLTLAYTVLYFMWDPTSQSLSWTDPALVSMIAAPIVLGIYVFLSVMTHQAYRFTGVLKGRFHDLGGLWEGADIGTGGKEVDVEVRPRRRRFHPIQLSFGHTADVVEQVPQLRDQLALAIKLFGFTTAALVADLTIGLLFPTGGIVPPNDLAATVWTGLFIAVPMLIVVGVMALMLLIEARRYAERLAFRLNVIRSVATAPPPVVPEGKTPQQRFRNYLVSRERRLGKASVTEPGNIGPMKGFDLAYPASLGKKEMTGGRGYLLLVRVCNDGPPGLEEVKAFRSDVKEAVLEYERKMGKRPKFLRAAMLCPDAGDIVLEDEVVDYILAHPIALAEWEGGCRFMANVQIVVEAEGVYEFVPFLPEGMV